jgi:hypothetical protein
VKILRSLAAIAAGYAVMAAILRGLAPAPADAGGMNYFLLSITWTVAGAMAGGYVAAFIAGSHEIPHAAGVGLLMVAMSIVSMRQQGASRPGWYETAIAGCGPIAAMIGAALRMLTRRGKPKDLGLR